MNLFLLITSLLSTSILAQSPTSTSTSTQPFHSAEPTSTNPSPSDLFKRDGNCPSNYNSCSNLGAPQLCCSSSAICSADANGYVACCATDAVCTGTVGSIITALPSSMASFSPAVSAPTTTNANGGLVLASGTNSLGYVVSGTQTIATITAGAARVAELPLIAQMVVGMFELFV